MARRNSTMKRTMRWVTTALVGIAALGFLSICITHRSSPSKNAARYATVLTLERAQTAIGEYRMINGHYPASLDDLLATNSAIAGTSGYIQASNRLLDAWGRGFRYLNLTNAYQLRSAGKDGLFDTRDDIIVGKR